MRIFEQNYISLPYSDRIVKKTDFKGLPKNDALKIPLKTCIDNNLKPDEVLGGILEKIQEGKEYSSVNSDNFISLIKSKSEIAGKIIKYINSLKTNESIKNLINTALNLFKNGYKENEADWILSNGMSANGEFHPAIIQLAELIKNSKLNNSSLQTDESSSMQTKEGVLKKAFKTAKSMIDEGEFHGYVFDVLTPALNCTNPSFSNIWLESVSKLRKKGISIENLLRISEALKECVDTEKVQKVPHIKKLLLSNLPSFENSEITDFIINRINVSFIRNKFCKNRYDLYNKFCKAHFDNNKNTIPLFLYNISDIVANCFDKNNRQKDYTNWLVDLERKNSPYNIKNLSEYCSYSDNNWHQLEKYINSNANDYFLINIKLLMDNNCEISEFAIDRFLELKDIKNPNYCDRDLIDFVHLSYDKQKFNPNIFKFIKKVLIKNKKGGSDDKITDYLKYCCNESGDKIDLKKCALYNKLEKEFQSDTTCNKNMIGYLLTTERAKQKDFPKQIQNMHKEKALSLYYIYKIFEYTETTGNSAEEILELRQKLLNECSEIKNAQEVKLENIDSRLFDNIFATYNLLNIIGEKAFLYLFKNNYSEIKQNIQTFGSNDPEAVEDLIQIINPKNSAKYKTIEQKLKDGKTELKTARTKEDSDLIIKNINSNSRILHEMQRNSQKDPKDIIDSINIYHLVNSKNSALARNILSRLAFRTEEEKHKLYKFLNKVLYKILFDKEFSKETMKSADFSQSKYLPLLFGNIGDNIIAELKGIINLLEENSGKTEKEIFDILPHNIKTRQDFAKYKIDYDSFTTYNPDSCIMTKPIKIDSADTKSLKVRKADMNNISHSLFLGNDAVCCTKINGTQGFNAPKYILNKAIGAIEVLDDETPVGNTMVYFAKVDGQPSLILDNIELKPIYQYKSEIKDGIVEYAKQLTKEAGRPDMKIYAGSLRHKVAFSLAGYKKHNICPIGYTDGGLYIDSISPYTTFNGIDSYTNELYNAD